MTNPSSWFAATTLLVGSLVPSFALAAAALPVTIDAFEGEVVQVSGTVHSGVAQGKALASGTEVKTGRDGRADLSLHGAPTLSLGPGVALLVHSVDQDVLRLRAASGALRVDTRTPSRSGGKTRDVRLNAGDLRLRLAAAEAWVEASERSSQVCVIAGVVEAQQHTGAVRLDTPGQCLRQTGQSSQWTMVPIDLLQARVAATGVPKAVAASAPAAPKPPLQIKVLPLPGTLPEDPAARPKIEVVQQAPSTDPVPVKLAAADVPAVPAPPAPLPVMPAAMTVAVKPPAPVELPGVPPAPEPLPVAPAPAERVSMKVDAAVEAPEPPPAPAPVPVPAPAPAPVTVTVETAVAEAAPAPAPASVIVAQQEPAMAPVAEPAPATTTTAVATAAPVTASALTDTSTADDGRRWRVVLGSMPEKEKAEMEAERLNARGWAVEAREYRVGERHGFRIGFGEFIARQDAQRALEEFLVQFPDAPAWLAKY